MVVVDKQVDRRIAATIMQEVRWSVGRIDARATLGPLG